MGGFTVVCFSCSCLCCFTSMLSVVYHMLIDAIGVNVSISGSICTDALLLFTTSSVGQQQSSGVNCLLLMQVCVR